MACVQGIQLTENMAQRLPAAAPHLPTPASSPAQLEIDSPATVPAPTWSIFSMRTACLEPHASRQTPAPLPVLWHPFPEGSQNVRVSQAVRSPNWGQRSLIRPCCMVSQILSGFRDTQLLRGRAVSHHIVCRRWFNCGTAQGRRTCCWEGPCGAVRLLERPSWFTAQPRTATPESPVASAAPSEVWRRLTPMAVAASPRVYLWRIL